MSAHKKLILVVDDDVGILEAIRAILTYAGYEVITDTGEMIQEKIQAYHPDLLLLDILLSGQDGRELTKRLKGQKETRHLPIILLSAHLNLETDAQNSGADDYVPKPFKMGDLLGKIVKYL